MSMMKFFSVLPAFCIRIFLACCYSTWVNSEMSMAALPRWRCGSGNFSAAMDISGSTEHWTGLSHVTVLAWTKTESHLLDFESTNLKLGLRIGRKQCKWNRIVWSYLMKVLVDNLCFASIFIQPNQWAH